MHRRFQRALDSLFVAPAALPSEEMIEPMFIEVVIAEEVEIIMALVLVQLIDIPNDIASLLCMRNTDDMSSKEGVNTAMSSAESISVRSQSSR